MSFHNLSISVLKVGRQLAGSLAVAAFFMPFFSSCIKEEAPIQPRPQGNLTTRTISLSSDYRYQIYYNLEQDSILSQNNKFDWDIALESSTEGSKVILNTAKFMSALKTSETQIENLKDTTGFFKSHKIEANNVPDSLAIGNVRNTYNVFWIDRGYDEQGDPVGLVKVKFETVADDKYIFKIGKPNSTLIETIEVKKDASRNYTYYSFKTNKSILIEPSKTDWDIVFTQYVHYFYEPYQPYLVTGVLLNPFNTYAAVDSTSDFQKIDKTMAESVKLNKSQDVIGYKWKEFGFGSSSYKVYSKYNYIIKNSRGTFFKMRFIDFYNEKGVKGYPKFEMQRL